MERQAPETHLEPEGNTDSLEKIVLPSDTTAERFYLLIIRIRYSLLAVFFCPFLEVAIVRIFFDDFVHDGKDIFVALLDGSRRVLDSIREFDIREHQVIIEDEILLTDNAFDNEAIHLTMLELEHDFRDMRKTDDLGILDLFLCQSFLCGGLLDADGLAVEIFYFLIFVRICLLDDDKLFCRQIVV